MSHDSPAGPPDVMTGKCGEPTTAGGRCKRPAGWGTDHPGVGSCKLHLGNTWGHQVAAAKAGFRMRAQQMLARLGEPDPVYVHPIRRLQALAGEADQWLDVCRAQMQALDGDFSIQTVMQGEQIRVVVREYTLAMAAVHKMHVDLVRLDLAGRAQALEEAELAVLAGAVDVMLARVVPPELHARARQVLAGELRRLDEQRPGLPAGTEGVVA